MNRLWHGVRGTLAGLLLGLLLAGCGGDKRAAEALPPPQELTAEAVGRTCGMFITEHAGPKGQLFIRDVAEPFWFSTVRDLLLFMEEPEWRDRVAVAYVQDMGRAQSWEKPGPGLWIPMASAVYVIGSRRRGGMGGAETVPFAERAVAEAFATQYGGLVMAGNAIPAAYLRRGEMSPPPPE